MISNCGHDENNRYSGGKAGDQTGTEWRVINWYNRPWKCVLRHPDAKVRKMIASMAKAAAVNNKIGYDQSERYTFWEHLKASNYDPAQITIACEADCSSGVAAIVKGAGYRLGNEKMKNVSIYLYTGNMRAGLKAAGFEVLTDSKGEKVNIYLDMKENRLVMDRTESGITDLGEPSKFNVHEKETDNHRMKLSVNYKNDFALGTWAPLSLCEGKTYHLNVFVDKCSIEIFVDGGRIAMTNLVFPNEPYDTLRFYSEGGEMKVSDFTVYKLGL